jgi:DNA-binding transcriptional LysR family regulator
MQVTALRYFQEVAECGSVRRAAEKLRITPSAISRQLQNLEYHFGAPLIERSRKGVRLDA